GHVAVLVLEGRVRVGPAGEELPGERGRGKARVADVEEARTAPGDSRVVWIAEPAPTEDETGPGIVRELRPHGEHRLRTRALTIGRGEDERLGGAAQDALRTHRRA